MGTIDKFSSDVCERLKSYVYRLIDPRNGNTFYVGKGKNNRVFAHVNAALKDTKENGINSKEETDDSLKIKTIQEIRAAGLDVIHVIQRWGMTDDEAILVESALIDCFQGLTNKQSGHNSEFGATNATTLQKTLSKKEYEEPDFPYVIIKIKQEFLAERGSVYETCRYAWKLSLEKVKSYKYVIAVLNGIVVGVFEIENWYKTRERNGRVAFDGKDAPENIRSIFIDKRIPSKYVAKGMASPALYSRED